VVTRGGFSQVVGNAFAGMGFPAEDPSVYEFPIPMFAAGGDLTPLTENIDKIIAGLTTWKPKITTTGTFTPTPITVQGKDYQSALDNMNALFLKNMWSDGLTLTPATVDRVSWILTGTDLARNTVISPPGGVVPRGGIASVESIAVALAMAGGRPEYLPLLIAIVQAITAPAFGLQALNSTTCSVIPATIVNGPIAKQIRLGSGYGCLGPDPVHPAGVLIGRALRIIQQDLGGAVPGIGTMAIYGADRTSNMVFAEDEEGLPPDWNSLAVDRGFAKTDNVVTATPISSMVNIVGVGKADYDMTLMLIAKIMASPNGNVIMASDAVWKSPDHATGIVYIPRGLAASIQSQKGYSKDAVKTFLWNNSKLPGSVATAIGQAGTTPVGLSPAVGFAAGQDIPLGDNPKQIMVVVAGGDQSGHAYWSQVGHSSYTVTSQKIQLPAAWNTLLAQAVNDLGPLPATH